MSKYIGVYTRVSTNRQSTRSQRPDLERWIKAQGTDIQVKWYSDSASGRNEDRPGWQKLQRAIDRGEISCILCWRLDRLGRSAAGLVKLFEVLRAKKINLISLKESIDLKSASGRLLANILASVAHFESELKSERIVAGQAAARSDTWRCLDCKTQFKTDIEPDACPSCQATQGQLKMVKEGRRWGGSKPGKLLSISKEQAKIILKLRDEGEKISRIARSVGVNRSSVYRVIQRYEQGVLKIVD